MTTDIKVTFHISVVLAASLSRLMRNIGGPVASKSATHYVLLCGCEIWADALHQGCSKQKMAAVQKNGNSGLRVFTKLSPNRPSSWWFDFKIVKNQIFYYMRH
ncbi:hypothetical protein J6590_004851 [Homalodisca vitripennis]|nr:hypothetical protein J6590_004851 [Homalodisca vitripennis]